MVRLSDRDKEFAEQLIKELKSIASIDPGSGDVTFSGFSFREYECLLTDLLRWNPAVPSDTTREYVSAALFEASRSPGLTVDRFLAVTSRLESQYLSRTSERYIWLSHRRSRPASPAADRLSR